MSPDPKKVAHCGQIKSATGILLAALALSACAGGDWPKLADVERPRASETFVLPSADTATEATGEGPAAPARPPADVTVLPLTDTALNRTAGQLDDALSALSQADAAYAAALQDFLSIKGEDDGEELASLWSVAQYRLTRLSVAVTGVAALNRTLAAMALGTDAETPPGLVLRLGREIARADDALAGRGDALLLENNRLSVLTPPGMGDEGPSVVTVDGRPAYVRIDLADPLVAFEGALAQPIARALEVAPDLRFDVIAGGADLAAAQAHLRRVTLALLRIGVPRDQLLGATDGEGAVVQIYLNAKSR